MANTSSAKKCVRQIARRTLVNRIRISKMRTFIKLVEKAIIDGKLTLAVENMRLAQALMMRNVKRGLLHKNTVARKVSRLTRKIKALSA